MSKHTEQLSIVHALLALYARGQFPMGDPRTGRIDVYDPDPRGVIPLDEGFHVPRTLAATVRRGRFQIRCDTAFDQVIRRCARTRPGREGGESTWITPPIHQMYLALHRAGHAHSVEAWLPTPGAGEVLVGGLYGVHLHGLFAGESMFSCPELGGTDASKVCLVHLVHHLRRQGFTLLDTQFVTPHLARFGARDIPRSEYQRRLGAAMQARTQWGILDPSLTRGSCA